MADQRRGLPKQVPEFRQEAPFCRAAQYHWPLFSKDPIPVVKGVNLCAFEIKLDEIW